MNKYTLLIGLFVLAAVAVAGYFYFSSSASVGVPGKSGSTPDMTACTMEAKICPDGTSVGRSGPNCEFAKCPGEAVQPKLKLDNNVNGEMQLQQGSIPGNQPRY